MQKNKKRVFYYYAVGDQVFVKIKGIIKNIDTPRIRPYTIMYMFTNVTFRMHCGKVNKHINISLLEPFL